MVEIIDICKTYKSKELNVEALKHVNLRIETGEIFGVIGLSGAGKSSLIRCINLLEKPDSGKIIINGNEITGTSSRELSNQRKKIGMVFQNFNLLRNSTVFKNIAYPLEISKVPKDEIKQRVNDALELVGLSDKADTYPSKLSGGQKQRVGIARAIVYKPDLILCDEATSALDPQTTESILELLKEINQKMKITMIVITHEMEVVKTICGRVAIIEAGEIIEQGDTLDVFLKPQTETGKKFFSTVNTDMNTDYYKMAIEKGTMIIKALFIGDKSTDSFMNNLIRSYNVDISILLGNIEHISETLVGVLVIKIKGKQEDLEKALTHLQELGILTEVLYDGN